ncbi:MAG: HORMA domain containing protein [Micromonosporaceae bacterium]|nr:HORMA domain containing protein [Micromonosporaceae bacterium]
MSTSVRVNTHTYATTHVATNMLRSVRQIIRESRLSPTKMQDDWEILESGIKTWLGTGHLRRLILEVYDPTRPADVDLVGRFDFTIDYGYYGDGDGDLWLDPDTVSYAVRKNGSYPERCDYRIVADLAPGYPPVSGWSTTTLRSTGGFTRHSVGTTIGGGSIGADLAYYIRRAQ